MVHRALLPTSHTARYLARRPLFINAAGPAYPVPFTIKFLPIEFALLRLQELHRKAVGAQGRPVFTAVAQRLNRAQARQAYGRSLYLSLAQMVAVGPRTRLQIFDHLCKFISQRGSIEGLEALFLTGLQAAQTQAAAKAGSGQREARAVAAAGAEMWRRIGPPTRLGGGAGVIPLYDFATNRLAFATSAALSGLSRKSSDDLTGGQSNFLPLASLFDGGAWPGGGLTGGFDGGIITGLGRQFRGLNPTDAVADDNGDRINGWGGAGAAIGGIVGGIVGGVAGGILGGAAGGLEGGPIGAAVGAGVGALGGASEGAQAGAAVGQGLGQWIAYETNPQPGGEQPGGEQPGGEEPGGEEPGGEQPGGEQPGGEEPGGEEPGGEQPGGEQPGGEQPGGEEPGGEQPGGEQPGGEQPGGEQPGGEQPGGEQPGGEQPGGEQPGGEQPGGEQPGGEQPGGESGGQSGGESGGQSGGESGGQSGGESGGESGGQSGGESPPEGSGGEEMPNSDAPDRDGGDDEGGVGLDVGMPVGPGLGGLINYTGGGVFTVGGLPGLDDDGRVINPGYMAPALISSRPSAGYPAPDGEDHDVEGTRPGSGIVDPFVV